MKAVLQTIRLLVILLFINRVRCQDGFSNRDILRLHQIASNDGQSESLSNYGNNLMQREQNTQSLAQVNYQIADESVKNDAYNRGDRERSRKVYRIKDPFQQRQLGDDVQQQDTNAATQDSDPGASNQYASMQYSLPPEEFLQQMRENPFFQQHQQVSTPAPNMGYTATPQPPYQYSTIPASGYDVNNQQQLEAKMSNAQNYRSHSNSYQYNGNSYIDTVQSTPSPLPSYISTPNNQYAGTSSNSYVSSSSPIFLSSQPNLQYVSSSMTAMQAGTPDYNNKGTSTIGSNTLNYENNDQLKKMHIDHYDNSANGIRYPINVQQYQNEYPTSTPSPSSTAYPEQWQNNMNVGSNSNSLSKSRQDLAMSQYQNYPYNRNPQDNRVDNSNENEAQRAGNVAAANNLYLNFVQPDYQVLANLRNRQRDVEQETSQPEYYSHGEYGWKLGGGDKKPLTQTSYSAANNYPRYQTLSSQPEGVAVSQMSFHMDTGKQPSYNHISKSAPDTTDPQEFAKAAAKAHENMKRQQLYESTFASNYNQNSPQFSSSTVNSYYNDKQRNKMYSEPSTSSPYYYGPQQELITVQPYYYANSRENSLEDKPKLPFDHDKALKNIVPIDVSNVVGENQQKTQVLDGNTRYSYSFRDQNEQAAKPNYKTIADSYYQDKNAVYGFNIKPKPEEITTDGLKLLESNYYNKAQSPEQYFHQGPYIDSKRFSESSPQQANYISQSISNYQDSIQSPANVQQQNLQRPQQPPTDISSILKLNDIPYRLTQNVPSESYRMHNGNYEPVGLPSPLPLRLNQNVGNHQLDMTSDILNRLVFNKHQALNMHRPENDPQSAGLLSTIHGFKVANPFNVDLKLVADVLKGKPTIDDTQIPGFRDQFNKPNPLKLDFSQIQQLMGANGNLAQLTDGLGAYSSPYIDIYNSGRYPYQGVKYSRSQEEEESIVPIADASNTHPIGAVIEQDEGQVSEGETGTDVTGHDGEAVGTVPGFSNDRPKTSYSSSHRGMGDRRHPNLLVSGRHRYNRKIPKSEITEPYPLLKPPPPHLSRSRGFGTRGKPSRRRRARRPKVRVFKTEPLFETESDVSEDSVESEVPILLRPPPIAEAKSDKVVESKNESS